MFIEVGEKMIASRNSYLVETDHLGNLVVSGHVLHRLMLANVCQHRTCYIS